METIIIKNLPIGTKLKLKKRAEKKKVIHISSGKGNVMEYIRNLIKEDIRK